MSSCHLTIGTAASVNRWVDGVDKYFHYELLLLLLFQLYFFLFWKQCCNNFSDHSSTNNKPPITSAFRATQLHQLITKILEQNMIRGSSWMQISMLKILSRDPIWTLILITIFNLFAILYRSFSQNVGSILSHSSWRALFKPSLYRVSSTDFRLDLCLGIGQVNL